MTTTTESPNKDASLVDELKALVAEAEALLSKSNAEHSPDAMHTLRERFKEAQERLSCGCDTAKKKVMAGARYTDETIRANPYQAVAIAAGVGLLAGWLLGHNRK